MRYWAGIYFDADSEEAAEAILKKLPDVVIEECIEQEEDEEEEIEDEDEK